MIGHNVHVEAYHGVLHYGVYDRVYRQDSDTPLSKCDLV